MTTNNYLLSNNKLLIELYTSIPGWWRVYNAEPQQKRYPWRSPAWRSGLQYSASSVRGGVCLWLVHELPKNKSGICRTEIKQMVSRKKKIFILMNFKSHIVRVLLMCLNSILQQCQSLRLLLTIFTLQSGSLHTHKLYIYCEILGV